jgi:SAM-dependent methyltransferase
MSRPDWYDLPELYDFLYDTDSRSEASFLLRVARRFGREPQRVLEPACGSGRLVRALAARGCEVAGFDRNVASLAYARRTLRSMGLRATLSRQDLAAFRCRRRYDLAHCLLSSFKYLQRERDAHSHLRCVAQALRPGGVYVLGLHLTDPAARSGCVESWQRQRPGLLVSVRLSTRRPDPGRRRERVEVVLKAQTATGRLERRDRWWWRTWTDAQLSRLLASVPALQLAACFDFDFRPRRLDDERLDKILVLRRRDQAIDQR